MPGRRVLRVNPSTERIVLGIVALLTGILGNYATATAPALKTSEANRDANWSARASLMQCHEERDKLLDKILHP